MGSDKVIQIEQMRKRRNRIMALAQKKGGPYTKQDTQTRRDEVYRYHFEYGYSARKISELLKKNRNTISKDIRYWYSKIAKTNDNQYESTLFTILERLEIQRTRIREYLDETSNISKKITIEKIILDIDYKIAQINQKISESSKTVTHLAMDSLNNYLKEQNQEPRYLSFEDKMSVSEPALKKIEKIIAEDKKNLWSRQN